MPFLKEINKDFYLENGQIKVTKEYLKEYLKHPKKITGGKVCSLIGADRWKTPFMTWCEMMGLYKEISDTMATSAGIVIEDIVFKFVNSAFGNKWVAYDAAEREYDEFSGKYEGFDYNPYFSGLLDGVPLDIKNTSILEIKTFCVDKILYKKDASKGDGIFHVEDKNGNLIIKEKSGGYSKFYPNGLDQAPIPPLAYKLQLGLYCYLLHNPKGLFAVAAIKPEHYKTPEKFIANFNTIKFIPFEQNLQQYEKDIIVPLTAWYKDFVLTGISPKITNQDKRWLFERLGPENYNKLISSIKPSVSCK